MKDNPDELKKTKIRNTKDLRSSEEKLKESEEKYRKLFETSQDAIMTLEPPEWNFMSGNPATIKMFKVMDETDFCSRPPWQYSPRRQLDGQLSKIKAKEMINKTIEEGSNFFNWTHKRSNGVLFPATVLLSRMKIGEKIVLQAKVRDITERKLAEQKLKESEEKYRLLFESSPFAIFLINSKGEIDECNSIVEEIIGYSKEELIGKKYSKLNIICSEYVPILFERFRKIKKGEILPLINVKFINKGGDVRWGSIQSRLITKDDKKTILVIIQDITDKIEADKKLKTSEKRLRLITENARDVIWTTDMNLNLTYVSPSTQSLSGWSPKEILNMKLNQYNTPTSFKILMDIFKTELRIERKKDKDLNRVRVFELQQIHKNGSIIDVEMIVTFLRDEKQKTIGLVGVTRDITEKKDVERKLKKSEEQYRTLFENSEVGMYRMKLDGSEVLAVNKKALEIIGLTKEEILSNPSFIRYENPANKDELMRKLGENGYIRDYEVKIKSYSDKIKTLLLSVNLISEKGWLEGSFMDISKQKKAEEDLKQFIAVAAHEFRTPITVIGQTISNLTKYKDRISNEVELKLKKILTRNISLLIDLVENLLITSKIEEKKIQLVWNKYELYHVIEDVIDTVSILKAISRKKITFNLDIDIDLQLLGDESRIYQIFTILIDNAIKYSKEKSIIEIKAINHYEGKYNKEEIEGALIQIKDSGLGVREEDIPHLFKRFFRSHDVINISGTGLGLSIAKELINLHKGEIYVESKHRKGTTINIFLPLLKEPIKI